MSKKHRIFLLCILCLLIIVFPKSTKKNMESEDSPPRSELVLNRDILSTPIKKVKMEVDSPKESNKAIVYEFPYLDTKPSVVSPKSTEKNMESEDSPPRSELVLNRDILSTPIKKVKKEVKKFEGTKIIDSPKESYEFPYLDTKPSVVSPKSTEKNMESEDSPPRSELVLNRDILSTPIKKVKKEVKKFEGTKIIDSPKESYEFPYLDTKPSVVSPSQLKKIWNQKIPHHDPN